MTNQAVNMLRRPEVCRRRGCSKAKLYQDIAKGLFPAPAKLGKDQRMARDRPH